MNELDGRFSNVVTPNSNRFACKSKERKPEKGDRQFVNNSIRVTGNKQKSSKIDK